MFNCGEQQTCCATHQWMLLKHFFGWRTDRCRGLHMAFRDHLLTHSHAHQLTHTFSDGAQSYSTSAVAVWCCPCFRTFTQWTEEKSSKHQRYLWGQKEKQVRVGAAWRLIYFTVTCHGCNIFYCKYYIWQHYNILWCGSGKEDYWCLLHFYSPFCLFPKMHWGQSALSLSTMGLNTTVLVIFVV